MARALSALPPRLRVLGKGNKPRVIPVGPELVDAISAYLVSREERAGRHRQNDPLFVRKVRGEYVPFNRQAMDALVLGWCRRAGVTSPPGSLAHALRHTYATMLVDAGASLPTRGPAAAGSRRSLHDSGVPEGG